MPPTVFGSPSFSSRMVACGGENARAAESCRRIWVMSGRGNSPTLLPPPPLRAFLPGKVRFRPVTDKEEEAWERGMVDSRECIHCNALTDIHHTPLQMQSNFKSAPPPFMDEIQRDMRVCL